MLHRTFPIVVLIRDCRKDFVQVIAVRTPNVGSQYFELSIGLDAVLNVA